MNHDWRSAIRRLIFILGGSVVFGWITDTGLWALCICLFGYLFWHLHQLHKLQTWLQNQEEEPPESRGLWGTTFDDVYRLQRRNRKARKRLKAVVKRVQDSTAALKDGVLMVDSDGQLEWWNQAASHLLGLQPESDYNQPLTNLVRDPSFKAYFDSLEYDVPLEVAGPINHNLKIEFHITLFGRQDRLIVCRDVTQLRLLESMREDFVANASHELRTPLTVISGYLETFLDYQDSLPRRWGRALKQMHEQSQRMQSLITDLLLLSRLETTHIPDQQRVSIESILQRLQQDAKTISEEKGHSITLECEPVDLIGVDTELSSAFGNLIFNAVKYTPEKGNIHIHWYADSQGAHLSVKDNGLGIDERHIPRLTERFYRADASRHSNTGGTGLGLAIVKHVLLRHGGQLNIKSRLGEGSEFICHFPATRIAQQSAPKDIKHDTKSNQKTGS
ncbi:phosphate regulon sensor histidine kinase PhoR [Bermanella sp. R86510]|uniref:phosphate regulon sensor histidine kinase PhoR n=1 Tax=unclassified Bermanella TaxID=2627862 RepID=UPI0037CB3813